MPPGSSASLRWCRMLNSRSPTGSLKSMSRRTSGWSRILSGSRMSAWMTVVVSVMARIALPCARTIGSLST